MVLTEEQRRRIEENRARAQARLREKRKTQPPPGFAEEDKKAAAPGQGSGAPAAAPAGARNTGGDTGTALDKQAERASPGRPQELDGELGPGGDRDREPPRPPPAKAGRLAGDVPGCRSTRAGGASGCSHTGKSSGSRLSGSSSAPGAEAAATAKCEGCAGAEGDERVDKELLEGFGVTVCRTCKLNNPDFQCVTKKEAKDTYLLPDGTIAVLKFIERDNPHHSSWTKMKLYLRRDVAEYSLKRWGGEDGVAAERRRRDSVKFDRSLARTKGMFKRSRSETESDGVAGGFL